MVYRKANGNKLTPEFLESRISQQFGKQKGISFCEALIEEGYTCYLYEARHTYSKYITVTDKTHRRFKVRFSNHKPIRYREKQGDCDFFVGVTNFKVTTTTDALKAVRDFFERENNE